MKNPAERTLDFTNKCKIGAKREKIALIKTTDLFVVSKYLKENKDIAYQKACRKAIYNGLGKIVRFLDGRGDWDSGEMIKFVENKGQ